MSEEKTKKEIATEQEVEARAKETEPSAEESDGGGQERQIPVVEIKGLIRSTPKRRIMP